MLFVLKFLIISYLILSKAFHHVNLYKARQASCLMLIQIPLPQSLSRRTLLINIKICNEKSPLAHHYLLQPRHRIPQNPIRERVLARSARGAEAAWDAELVRVVAVEEGPVAVQGDVGRELLLDGREDDFDFHGGQGVRVVQADGDEG